jgi:hypothetical protein
MFAPGRLAKRTDDLGERARQTAKTRYGVLARKLIRQTKTVSGAD